MPLKRVSKNRIRKFVSLALDSGSDSVLILGVDSDLDSDPVLFREVAMPAANIRRFAECSRKEA